MTKPLKIKVRVHDIIARTEKATLFLFGEREVWIPNWAHSKGPGRHLLIDPKIAQEKALRGVEYDPIHRPEPLAVVPDQEPIDELRYAPK